MTGFKRFLFPRISIRVKLFIIVIFFAILPWFGYRYLWEIDSYLKLSQQHSLTATSQAVATALNQRPTVFTQLNSTRTKQGVSDFYNYPLKRPILPSSLTTFLQRKQDKLKHFGAQFITHKFEHVNAASYSVDALFGSFDGDTYAVFAVNTPTISTIPQGSFRFDKGDHFIIATQNTQKELVRYIVALNQDHTLTVALLPSNPAMIVPQTIQTDYQGFWRNSKNGFNLVLNIPSSAIGNKVSIAAYFSPLNEPDTHQLVIESNPTNSVFSLGNFIKPSSTIEAIIQSLSYTSARIWVLNDVAQVLATGGDIHTNGNNLSQEQQPKTASNYLTLVLKPIYQIFSKNTDTNFVDPLNNATEINSKIVKRALKGFTASERYTTPDNKAEIIASASPIWDKNEVIGVVVSEQSTLGIRTLRNHAMQSLLNTVFIVLLLASVAIILFASSISNRITALRNDAREAVDQRGKFNHFSYTSNSRDEIGDLGRCFEEVMQQLGQYNQYLEKMSSRLSHELRTPITVIRSSLEHLQLSSTGSNLTEKYLNRAQEGLKRLSLILNSMTEASRLESSLKEEHKEVFNLTEVVSGVIEGYHLGYPESVFKLDSSINKVLINGVPEYFAQLLDKLTSNAIDFSPSRRPIIFSITEMNEIVEVSISNEGEFLPSGMEKEIFNSLISIRNDHSGPDPHLGFGLHIAKLITDFHEGHISASNRTDVTGVIVKISLPRHREAT